MLVPRQGRGGAPVSNEMGATEDAVLGRAARPGGTAGISPDPPRPSTWLQPGAPVDPGCVDRRWVEERGAAMVRPHVELVQARNAFTSAPPFASSCACTPSHAARRRSGRAARVGARRPRRPPLFRSSCHDSLVQGRKGWTSLPSMPARMFCAAQSPACCATLPSCGSASSFSDGWFAKSPSAYTPGEPSTVRSA